MKKRTSSFNLSFLFLLVTFGLSGQNISEPECGTIITTESQQFWQDTKPTIQKFEKEFYQISSPQARASIVNSIPIKAHIIRKQTEQVDYQILTLMMPLQI